MEAPTASTEETMTTVDATGKPLSEQLTISTRLITDEAKRRNISIEFIVPSRGLFRLTLGNNSILCQRALTEKTNAVSGEICLNKHLANSVLKRAGINVPDQILAADHKTNKTFFQKHKRVVIKPPSLSRGHGISVDIRSVSEMDKAIHNLLESASEFALIEEFVQGEDLRIVVIDYKFVAALHRTPPQIVGDGKQTVMELIRAENEKKGPKNRTPLNYETKRCVLLEGFKMKDIVPEGKVILIRKNTNESTGGTPTDVTDIISPGLRKVAERVAEVINIPVIGIDFLVPKVDGDEYTILEVNRRPGLDGHEPQPVVEKFIDFLFPETVA